MPKYTKKEAREWAREHLTGDVSTQTAVFREDDGSLDLEAMKDNFRRALKFGSDGILVNGQVCEQSSLTMAEKKKIVEAAVEVGEENKVPVVEIVSYLSMYEMMEMVKHAEDTGIDCVFMCGPLGETVSEEGVYQWHKYIADHSNLCLFIFNSARFHPLSPRNIARIAVECPNIAGLKPCPDVFAAALMQAFKDANTELLVFTPFGMTGFPSVLNGTIPPRLAHYSGSNRFMLQTQEDQIATKCWQLVKKGDMAGARKLYYPTIEARANALFYAKLFTWVTPYTPTHDLPLWKYWLELMGFHGGPCRLPYTPPSAEAKADLKAAMIAYGVIKG